MKSKCSCCLVKGETRSKKMEFIGWGSKPLLDFLASIGKDTNQEMSQGYITTLITEYCRENKLFHSENEIKIICDSTLQTLFRRKIVNRNSIYRLLTTHLAENLDRSEDEFRLSSEDDDFVLCKSQQRMSSGKNCMGKKVVIDVQKCCFAAIIPENVKLVYLRKSLVEKLSNEIETFEVKVIGSFVRVKSDLPRNSHQLVQVTGVKSSSSMSSEILLQVSNMVKEVPISKLSDDDFSKEECEDLCRRVEGGLIKRPTVAELGHKARSLHKNITKHKPAEQSWLLREVPEVIADTVEAEPAYENSIRKGDGNTSKAEEAALEFTADLSNDDCTESSEASISEDNSSQRKSMWSIDAIRSTMTPRCVEHHRVKYGIPNNIVLRLPEKGQLASSPPQESEVALLSASFEFGVNLPFHPFLRYMLRRLNCAPAQLGPNVWRALIGTYIIWKQCQLPELTFREFMNLYQLKSIPNYHGWYYVSAWPGKEVMVTDNPSSNKDWKNKWFFASGHWGAQPSEQVFEHRIPTRFSNQVGAAYWKKKPMVTEEQKRNIKIASAIPQKDRSWKVLLTPENLQRHFTITHLSSSSQGGPKKRYIPKEVPIEIPSKVPTKRMRVESSFHKGSVPISANSSLNSTSEHQTPPPTPHASQMPPVVVVGSSSLGTKKTTPAQDPHHQAEERAQQEAKHKYLVSLTNEWSRYVSFQEVEKVQMLSLEEAISTGLSHNFKAVCSALDWQERMQALQDDNKILFGHLGQTIERNFKLQGQLDEERALSASLKEQIVTLKATVIEAKSRAATTEARADAT
ncbi:hypothetical protein EZV62_018932 [Acer yangbiense]|uniref:Uncharacterized protein n=1 Tax=Acer yangbiense TaxID=1000413 RepID=A0A5C7HBX5_9ROSI|nr:hypothetical protein EZV62_018932 [Acer yangbiense]